MITVEEYFAGEPAHRASAPGRVNVLGEHTDYNDGFVLPTALPCQTWVAIDHSADAAFHLYSATLDQAVSFPHQGPAPEGFARYIEGCVRLVEERGFSVPPAKIYINSDVPLGAGLSSSAALEVATLRALRSWLKLDIDDVAIALMGQQAEIRYAKVNVGVMDQMASSLADSEHLLFLDTRTLERRLLPLPPGGQLIVIDSGVARTLAASKYNERRAECQEAARRLGVPALRDVVDPAAVERLPSPFRERARHVVNENNRVLEASRGVSAKRLGTLMNASHASLRDDYEVSIGALDRLTELLRTHLGVFGARLTGAGFGGACVALCRMDAARQAAAEVLARYNNEGYRGRILIPEPGD
ncbi:MAG: galactokinase [Burkholderiales bacterium]|nr:galactokinase [Burkholderiales bacterium]